MKPRQFVMPCLTALSLSAITLGTSGCASAVEGNTENTFTIAGFHAVTPSTPEQKACYAALRRYKLQRYEIDGKVLYVYADKRAGVVYVGDEKDYEHYKQLGEQQRISGRRLEAAEMKTGAAQNWDGWSAEEPR